MLTNFGFLNLTGQPYQLGLNFVGLGLEGIFDPPTIETTSKRNSTENNRGENHREADYRIAQDEVCCAT